MHRPPEAVDADADIAEALRIMAERHFSCLLVRRMGAICGIVTEKDLVRCYSDVSSHSRAKVADIMTAAPLTVPADMGHLEAFRLMSEHHIRHLPVVDRAGEVVGIITESDYLRGLGPDYYIRLKDVSSAMAPVVALRQDDTLAQALELLARPDVSCVVIGGQGGAKGIVTERDVVRLLRSGTMPERTALAEVMTAPVVTVPWDSTLLDASQVLAEKRIRRVVVVDAALHPVGILGQHEIVKGLEGEYIDHLKGLVAEKSHALTELDAVRRALEDQTALLHQAVDALSLAHSELRRYATVAAHDLQEPVRSVVSYSQLLDRDYRAAVTGVGHDYLTYIIDGAKRMKRSVDDLVAYAASASSAERLERIAVDDALGIALTLLGRDLAAAAAEVVRSPMPTVLSSRSMLVEIFCALIGNAIRFRRPGIAPIVRLSAAGEEGAWHFVVEDNGIGIEPQYLETIFGLFTRLHTPTLYPGSGVGLAICRRMVVLLGGRIWADSIPGQGSSFHFTLGRQSEDTL